MTGPAQQLHPRATLLRIEASAGRAAWRVLVAWLEAAHERRRQRRALADLDDRSLRDIGLSRHQAECEAAKPFWR
ncbi:MAG: DUF1127 domain-containing protein [Geminicoccaceae bacterium]